MKRIISILISATLIFSAMVVPASADSEALLRVQGYGIMQGDENSMRLDDNITRAEFAAVVCRMSGIFEAAVSQTKFDDVPSSHWASGYINMAESMDIICGVGDNLFAPDRFVTYDEAAKMIVCLLGYDIAAEQKGGWPTGYNVTAGAIGLLKNVDTSAEYATRGEIVKIIDNALDVEIITPEYGKTNSYVKAGYTLSQNLDERLETVYFEGVVTEYELKTLASSTEDFESGRVVIDSTVYYTNEDVSDLFALAVCGYAAKERGGKLRILSIAANDNLNEVKSFSGEDVEFYGAGASYYTESGVQKEIMFEASPVYVLNGRHIAVPEPYLSSDTAVYTFADNNGNRRVDVILIEDSQSFVIDKINSKNSFVYFEANKYFKGKRGLELVCTDDDRMIYLCDSAGGKLSFDDVEAGDVITVCASEDEKLMYAWITKETVSGMIDEIDGKGRVCIDGSWYRSFESLSVGDSGTFALDKNHAIAGVFDAKPSEFTYGYIIDARVSAGLDNSINLLIVEEGSAQKEIKDVSGAEQISYYLQNSPEKTYTLSSKIKFTDEYSHQGTDTLDADSLNPASLKGKAAGFKLNARGEISALSVFDVPATPEKCTFNAEIFAFGGESVSRGYIADEQTKVICVPNTVKTTEDYGVRVYITDAASYSAFGINCTSEYAPGSDEYKREPVDLLIVKADMDSSKPYPIQNDSDICMVGEFKRSIDADGEEIGKLEMLNGEDAINLVVRPDSPAYSVVCSLRMGDLVQYVPDGNGDIANIKKLASVQGLKSYTSSSNYYGLAHDVHYDAYDYMSNRLTDLVEISFANNSDNKNIKIFKDDQQNIYHYNRTRGYVEPATTDDIVSSLQSGTNPSKLFALIDKNDVLCLVIISD